MGSSWSGVLRGVRGKSTPRRVSIDDGTKGSGRENK